MFITSEISKENKGKLNNKTDGIIFTPMHHVRNIPYRRNVYAGYSPCQKSSLTSMAFENHSTTSHKYLHHIIIFTLRSCLKNVSQLSSQIYVTYDTLLLTIALQKSKYFGKIVYFIFVSDCLTELDSNTHTPRYHYKSYFAQFGKIMLHIRTIIS